MSNPSESSTESEIEDAVLDRVASDSNWPSHAYRGTLGGIIVTVIIMVSGSVGPYTSPTFEDGVCVALVGFSLTAFTRSWNHWFLGFVIALSVAGVFFFVGPKIIPVAMLSGLFIALIVGHLLRW